MNGFYAQSVDGVIVTHPAFRKKDLDNAAIRLEKQGRWDAEPMLVKAAIDFVLARYICLQTTASQIAVAVCFQFG